MRWLILLILLTGCEKMRFFHAQNSPNMTSGGFMIPTADGTTGSDVYFFGDSITNGVGASVSSARWTTLLSSAKGWTENTTGLNGYHIAPVGSCTSRSLWDKTTIPTKTNAMKYLFIAFGVNDHFLDNSNTTSAQYQTAIEQAIDEATSKGWQNRRIIILPPYYTNYNNSGQASYCSPALTDGTRKAAFVAAAQAAANAKGTNYYNIYQYMADNGGNSLIGDGIHPNDAGYVVIKDALNAFVP
jgi:lysophospholipase L1-like esterase